MADIDREAPLTGEPQPVDNSTTGRSTTAAADEVYRAGRAGQWWYRCDRGRGLWGPFKTAESARFACDAHRRLHVLTVEEERQQVAAR